MPRGDGTGPAGMGPMSGRAAGYCAGYAVPGYMNAIPGRGMGFGFGRGMGMGFRGRHRFNPYVGYGYAQPFVAPYGVEVTQQQEVEALQNQAKHLETALEQINQRITELEKQEKA